MPVFIEKLPYEDSLILQSILMTSSEFNDAEGTRQIPMIFSIVEGSRKSVAQKQVFQLCLKGFP